MALTQDWEGTGCCGSFSSYGPSGAVWLAGLGVLQKDHLILTVMQSIRVTNLVVARVFKFGSLLRFAAVAPCGFVLPPCNWLCICLGSMILAYWLSA